MEKEQEFEEPISLNFCYGINECFGSVWVISQNQDEKWEKSNESEKKETENNKIETKERKKDISIIYSVDNNLVVLNGKKQTLYRGHFNKISKITKSRKYNFLASCDKGPDSFILLWKINGDSLEPFKKLKRVNFTVQRISDKEKNKKKSMCVNDEDNINRKDENEKNGPYDNNYSKKSIKREKSSFSDSPSTQTEDEEEEIPDIDTDTGTNIRGRDRSKRGKEKKKDIIGFETIDISYDNRYLCAISEEKPYLKTEGIKSKLSNPCFQEILIFDLNEEHNYIVCSDKIYGVEKQTKIRFNKNYEIVSNSKKKLYFYHFDKKNKTLTHYSPSLYKTNKTKENFIFTESSFIENSTQVITGTQNGFLIIWNYSNIFLNKNKNTVKQREYQKYLEIKKRISINVVLNYGKYIILGLQDGSVQVFDTQLKCYAWFENKNIGSIRSIDFEHSDFQKDFRKWNSFIVFSEKNIIKRIFPNSHTTYFLTNEEKEKNEKKTDVQLNTHTDVNINKSISSEILLQFHCTSISSFCTNYMEDENILIIGSTNGKIEVFDFDKNETLAVFNLKQKEIVKMTFNSKGDILCVGCKCGFVFLINAKKALHLKNGKEKKIPSHEHFIKKIDMKQINEIENDRETKTTAETEAETYKEREGSECDIMFSSKDIKQEIHFICFSDDDRILVCCSLNGNLIIYKKESNTNRINNQRTSNINNKNTSEWKYAHKIVNDNNFQIHDLTVIKNLKKYYVYTIVAITNTKHILFYYYDYQNNTISISYLKNEQIATSTCLTGNLYFYNRQILCICNDQSKLRFFDVENKQIVKTVHLPFKNKHIQTFLLLRPKKEDKNKQETKLEAQAMAEKQEASKKEKNKMYITEKEIKSSNSLLNKKNSTAFQENSIEFLKNSFSEDSPNIHPNSISSTNFEKNDFKKKNIFLFVLNEKMIVFTMNPLNANCFRYIGVIVCSDIINDITFKNNCIFILSKNHIFYFQLNREVIKSYIEMQNNTLQTFINQIGGENGPLYKQIINSFYYCEIQKKKNENRKEKHNIKKILNILSIEYIFASINVFLSKFEIQNIIQEYHFYYKYVKNILIQNGVPINTKIKIGEQTLVSYKSDDDLLLQNIFFLQDSESEGSSSKNVSERKKEKKERTLQKKVELNKKEEEEKTDIAEECKNIYFNMNAFIYTYFNFPEEEKINMEETIIEIINYYKTKMQKNSISYNDFLYILKNFGESMEQAEFKRIFQIFSKNNKFLNLEEKMELHQLQNLFQ